MEGEESTYKFDPQEVTKKILKLINYGHFFCVCDIGRGDQSLRPDVSDVPVLRPIPIRANYY